MTVPVIPAQITVRRMSGPRGFFPAETARNELFEVSDTLSLVRWIHGIYQTSVLASRHWLTFSSVFEYIQYLQTP
jgi:hypothetical protein